MWLNADCLFFLNSKWSHACRKKLGRRDKDSCGETPVGWENQTGLNGD